MTRQVDLVAAMGRVLLDEPGDSAAATLQAAAELIRAELADWVIVDLLRGPEIHRGVVCGPRDPASLLTARELEQVPVGRSALPRSVIDGAGTVLDAHLEDHSGLDEDDQGVPFLSRMRAHSLVCLPLVVDAVTVGALTAVRSVGRAPVSLLDHAGLQTMTDLLAVALHTDRRRRREEVDSVVRSSLLPQRVRTPPGTEIASRFRVGALTGEAGGDFFDVCESAAGWSIVLGDAAGGGDEAAAQALVTRQATRLYSLTAPDPGSVLARTDESIRRLPDSDRPIRVVIAALQIDDEGVRVHLASAGHLSSTVLRADGRVLRVDGGGIALASHEPLRVHDDHVTLDPGDCLVMYSDGVLDAANETGARFEESGALARVLTRVRGESAEAVVAAVDAGLGDLSLYRAADDVVVIAVKPTTRVL